MPTLDELSRILVERDPESSSQIPAKLKTNIELALAYLGSRHPWDDDATYYANLACALRLIRRIGSVIEERESKCGADVNSRLPHWLIRLAHWMHDEQVSILSFNYDTLLEKAFELIDISEVDDGQAARPLDPINLYPIELHQSGVNAGKQNLATAEIVKLHGSINWYYSGAREYFGEALHYLPPLSLRSDRKTLFQQKPPDKTPLIVPPVSDKLSYFNHEAIRFLWSTAKRRLSEATNVYCVGFSFPQADLHTRFFLQDRVRSKKILYLVNPDESLYDRVASFVPEGWEVNGEFLGQQCIERLADHLTVAGPPWLSATIVDQKGELVRKWCTACLREGGSYKNLNWSTVTLLGIGEKTMHIEDEDRRIPIHLPWAALSIVVSRLASRGALPIYSTDQGPSDSSVESIMRWFCWRACARAVATILLASRIANPHGGSATYVLDGITEEFRREYEGV